MCRSSSEKTLFSFAWDACGAMSPVLALANGAIRRPQGEAGCPARSGRTWRSWCLASRKTARSRSLFPALDLQRKGQ